jgi:hypothetical protein
MKKEDGIVGYAAKFLIYDRARYFDRRVETAHINSGAGQSLFRSHPMLSNGWINIFPQQRSHPRFHGSSSANAL